MSYIMIDIWSWQKEAFKDTNPNEANEIGKTIDMDDE